jgi:hypothetical protein
MERMYYVQLDERNDYSWITNVSLINPCEGFDIRNICAVTFGPEGPLELDARQAIEVMRAIPSHHFSIWSTDECGSVKGHRRKVIGSKG